MSAAPETESDKEREKLGEGTLISHLLELRARLIRAGVAVVLLWIPSMIFQNEIFEFISKPLIEKLPKNGSLIATGVISPFSTPFKLSFFVALFAAMPYVLWQAWAFVAPGLYKHEKRFAIPLVLSSIVLFYTGIAFAYVAVFPVMFAFLTATTPKGVAMMTDITSYMDFVLTMFFAFGVAFEVPIAVVLLVLTGLVNLETLKGARGYVLIGVFVAAAILTPTTDALSQIIMAVPMYLLYEGGMIMARVLSRMRREQQEREERQHKDD
jgi:sec-independent protein translocase protein TatC